MKQEFSPPPPTFLRKNFQPAGLVERYLLIQIVLCAEIIDSMLDIFKPPFSIALTNAAHFTLSFSFQTKEYNKVFMFLMNSFSLEMRVTLYRIFGMARENLQHCAVRTVLRYKLSRVAYRWPPGKLPLPRKYGIG